MSYPAQIELEEETEQAVISYLVTELDNHLAERSRWIEDINNSQRDYLAQPSADSDDFPFVGSSNLVIPLIAIAAEAIESRTIQKLFALPQKVSVKIKDPEVEYLQDELEIFLDDEFNLQGKCIESLLPAIQEIILLGTGVAQATYEKVTKKGMRNGKPFEVVLTEGNTFKATPLTSFVQPFDNQETQTSRWSGEVFWMTPYEVPQAVRDGLFREGSTEILKGWYTPNSGNDEAIKSLQYQEELAKMVPIYPERLQFYSIYFQFILDNPTEEQRYRASSLNLPCEDSDNFVECHAILHKESRQLVSLTYNAFEDLRRPHRTCQYFPKPFRWDGLGVAFQTKAFQEEVTIQHRQIIDSGTLANTRMFVVRKGTNSIRDGEPIYPNKIWWVDDMDDIRQMDMKDIFTSAYNMENQAGIYAQQRNGVNELTLGMPGVGTPGTATDSSLRVQESQRKGDYTYGNKKRWISQLYKDGLLNIVQYGPNVERLQYSPLGNELETFLKRPYEDFRKQLICSVALVDQNDNQMLDRQTMTQLSQMAREYYNNILPVLQALVPQPAGPQGPAPAIDPMLYEGYRTAISGANRVFSKILETFGIRDPQKYLIKVPPAQTQQPNVQTPQDPNSNQGLISGPSAGSQLTIPSSTVNNINLSTPDISGQIPSGLASLLP
jgi:hypothetical protein